MVNEKLTWTEIQSRRLAELDADPLVLERFFKTSGERNRCFQQLEKELIRKARYRLDQFRNHIRRPQLCRLETRLIEALNAAGFIQVTTPTLLARGLLARMSIDEKHPLYSQVYWVDRNHCLRPMLAPHLYYLLVDLLRLWDKPVRIFEIGSCFRRESQGSRHASEFTMLNLVEMGLPLDHRQERLEELAALVCDAAGLKDYEIETEQSAVYGETIDIVNVEDRLELGSCAMGPHPLDAAWQIYENWVGLGFGLERLLMANRNSKNLAKVGKSLAYLDGVRLNV